MSKSPKLKALEMQIQSGKMVTDSGKILDTIIRHKSMTIPNIVYWTKIKESTVVARLSDLEELGIIQKSGTNKQGKHSLWIYVPDENERRKNQDKIQIRRYLQWINRGLKHYRNLMNIDLISELDISKIHFE